VLFARLGDGRLNSRTGKCFLFEGRVLIRKALAKLEKRGFEDWRWFFARRASL